MMGAPMPTRDSGSSGLDIEKIEGALHSYWLERSMNAPTTEKVREHIAAEEKYFAELKSDAGGSGRVNREVRGK